MCGVAEAGIAIAVISTAASVAGQIQQNRTQNQIAEVTSVNANNQVKATYNSLEEQQSQIDEQFQLQAFERQRQALRERAKIRVAAGESGVSGNELARELGDSEMQAAWDTGILRTNNENDRFGTRKAMQNAQLGGQSNINEAKSKASSPWGTMLGIGTAIAGGASQGMSAYNKLDKTPSRGNLPELKYSPKPYGDQYSDFINGR